MFIRTQVRDSAIFGKGLFADEAVKRGTILCLFTTHAEIITEAQFLAALEAGDALITRTGTRLAGRYFTCKQERDPSVPTQYFNHSFTPNCVAHCGIVLARQDLRPGDELTVDYRTLVDATDVGLYNDATTGREIRGFTAKETFLRTAREMIEIVEGTEGWEG